MHQLPFSKLRIFLTGSLLLLCVVSTRAQEIGVKTNFLYWGVMVSPNIEAEFSLNDKSTLELGGGFNLWKFDKNKKVRHWLLQPEYRYWFCESFNGHFVGMHAHVAQFNVGVWDIPFGRLKNLKDYRYQGYLYGGGLSYGYQWILNPRWNLEVNIGAGYARIHYEKYPCAICSTKLTEGVYNYFGITKAAISLVYMIK